MMNYLALIEEQLIAPNLNELKINIQKLVKLLINLQQIIKINVFILLEHRDLLLLHVNLRYFLFLVFQVNLFLIFAKFFCISYIFICFFFFILLNLLISKVHSQNHNKNSNST